MLTRPRLLLDATRCLRRVRHPQASGIDRVERAYLDWVLARQGHLLIKVAGRFHKLDDTGGRLFRAFLDGDAPPLDLTAVLRPDRNPRLRRGEALIRRHAVAEGALPDLAADADIYLNVGHVNLEAETMVALGVRRVSRVVMLHDLIPLDHPEFSRPGVPEEMSSRLTAAMLADHLLTNSADTAERARDQSLNLGVPLPPLSVLPLGVSRSAIRAKPASRPYFVCLGTIEPRKNHAMLLDIWEAGQGRGELHIVGRRGWMNDDVFKRLDRRSRQDIHEHADLDDDNLRELLSGARALLFPSFAEGYGLPLAEALEMGVPAIASDLAALREVGKDVPVYLPPGDRDAWTRQIAHYADDTTQRREQLDRLSEWEPPRWDTHFSALDAIVDAMIQTRPRRG